MVVWKVEKTADLKAVWKDTTTAVRMAARMAALMVPSMAAM